MLFLITDQELITVYGAFTNFQAALIYKRDLQKLGRESVLYHATAITGVNGV